MPIIVLKHRPLWNREKVLAAVILILFLIIVSMIVLAIREAKARQPQKLLQAAVNAMQENDKLLGVQITEQGEGYILKFYGRMRGKCTLSGEFPDYKLQIYRNQRGDLYVKDLIEECWEKAAALKLDNLEDLLVAPLKILEQNQEHFKEAVFAGGGEENEHVIRFPLEPASFLPALVLPAGAGLSPECILYVTEGNLFVSRVSFVLFDHVSQKEIINRTLLFRDTDVLEVLPAEKEVASAPAAYRVKQFPSQWLSIESIGCK